VSLFDHPVEDSAAPRGLGTAMAGGKGKLATTPRRAHDYYPTPWEATRALLTAERPYLERSGEPIWEPCGRGGAIMAEIAKAGFDCIGTDIVPDPANGVTEANLLEVTTPPARRAITNPPFNLSAKMIVHLLDRLQMDYVALLLKATYWHSGTTRGPLFHGFRPSREHKIGWRLDFVGGGAPVMDCSWFIWDRSHIGPPTWDVLLPASNIPQTMELFA
jgi:hypothetical protein